MYLSLRLAQVRNLSVALVNGVITLVILLIAPLGLAAVITNTLLVTFGSFTTATIADRVVLFLQADPQRAELLNSPRRRNPGRRLPPSNPQDLDRF